VQRHYQTRLSGDPLTPDEDEAVLAVLQYRQNLNRRFPTVSEIFRVIMSLGYKKSTLQKEIVYRGVRLYPNSTARELADLLNLHDDDRAIPHLRLKVLEREGRVEVSGAKVYKKRLSKTWVIKRSKERKQKVKLVG